MSYFEFVPSSVRMKPEELCLHHRIAGARVMIALYRINALLRRFDPNQPRVPAGSSDGGQWTDGSGSAPDTDFDETDQSDGAEPDSYLRRIAYTPEAPDEPPRVPSKPPASGSERAAIVKNTVRWLVRSATSRTPVGRGVRAMIEAADWARPYIQSYFDTPKSLEELQRAAAEPKTGYDIHHLVERTSARNAGFPESLIDGPQNTVRIPKLKHWEVNSWFERINDNYGGLTPRQYLRNPEIGWEERVKIGTDALSEVGVLKR